MKDNMNEIWRGIPGLPYHEASNRYQIRSIDHIVTCGNGWGTGTMTRPVKGRILKIHNGKCRSKARPVKNQIPCVTITCPDGMQREFHVSELVKAAFPDGVDP